MSVTIQYTWKKPTEVEFWEFLPSSSAELAALREYHTMHWGDRFQVVGIPPNDANLYIYQFINTSDEEINSFYDKLAFTPLGDYHYHHVDYSSKNNIELIHEIITI
jgi:hypothetical protein